MVHSQDTGDGLSTGVPSSSERAEQFTRARWYVGGDRRSVMIYRETVDRGDVIAIAGSPVQSNGAVSSLDEAEANARLIAAAPDLYEALKGLVDDDDAGVSLADQRARHPARMAAAKAAILKANGGSQ